MRKILVINPNRSIPITQSMRTALEPLAQPGRETVCIHDPDGPPGIQSQGDIYRAANSVCSLIAANPADAYVIGCFSDPGLVQAREEFRQPIFGIGESSFKMALSIGHRFGVLAMVPASVPRHKRYIRQLGLEERLAGDRPIGVPVTQIQEGGVIEPLLEAGRRLRDEDGADVLVFGCSGLGFLRERVEDSLKMPVVDPTQAAVAFAMMHLTLGYKPNL